MFEDFQKNIDIGVRSVSIVKFAIPHQKVLNQGEFEQPLTGGIGDFVEHRPYREGDEIRSIDWRAFGKTDSLLVRKLQLSVTPVVDCFVDISSSIFFRKEKSSRVLQLLSWLKYSCAEQGIQFSLNGWSEDTIINLRDLDSLNTSIKSSSKSILPKISLVNDTISNSSIRILVTDCLFSYDPISVINTFNSHRKNGNLIVFSVFTDSEVELNYSGVVSFVDPEDSKVPQKKIILDAKEKKLYKQRYNAHFQAWSEAAIKLGCLFIRIAANCEFLDSLNGDAIRLGIVKGN